MKKLYSKFLFFILLFLTSSKNLFINKTNAQVDVDFMPSAGIVMAPERPTFINIIRLVVFSPILAISILLILIYTICRIKRKNTANNRLLLITGIIGVILFISSTLPSYLNYVHGDNLNLILMIVSTLVLIILLGAFLFFFVKIIVIFINFIINTKYKKNDPPSQINMPINKE